ncbi:MAG: glycine--tRNA ligase subunit beta [Betaproteobacteria bacterium]|nr:MAG: glycine--tRNA ligase subunit beta [Betaproteobacteria bacterium]
MNSLLVELLLEELPPKALQKLGEAFADGVFASLKAQGLLADDAVATPFASPRRLAVHLTQVAAQAADKAVSQKLMPVAVGLSADGQATPALLKKLAALGVDASAVAGLKREGEGRAETLFFEAMAQGASLAQGLQKALDETLAKLPIPKVMSYQLADGWTSVNFVRPAHGLVALHGRDIVPISALGLVSGRVTQGHRFEAATPTLSLADADGYAAQMATEGAVIASFAKRRAEIVRQLEAAAAQIGNGVKPTPDAALLDEVTALVERPNVLLCQFEAAFLQVPPECLILTMKANQKYFPLQDASGALTNQFLIVSNISPADPSMVIQGNERVVRPRLADAKFFFDQDRKRPLMDRVAALDKVVYHNKLGSLGARVERVRHIARAIAHALGHDAARVDQADQAAQLAKTDLLTDMVGEFPELQGIMGRYYALSDGLSATVAEAIEDHYKPRFAGDALPRNAVGMVVALADKLETLTGLFGIGQIPTGDKDPFALRRHALGVLRILLEQGLALSLKQVLQQAQAAFVDSAAEQISATTAVDVYRFMQDRLRIYLKDQGHAADAVEAVVGQKPERIDQIPARLAALQDFRTLPEAAALAAANKRIRNILKKTEGAVGSVTVAHLQDAAEHHLHSVLIAIEPVVNGALAEGDYAGALTALAAFKEPVDAFFDAVMVMADDPLVRGNRLALLAHLGRLMNSVADISELAA